MIKSTPTEIIDRIIKEQRSFFATHKTKCVEERREQLRKLERLVKEREEDIADALWRDLRKSPQEAYLTETALVIGELKNHIRNLKRWTKPKRVPTPLFMKPSRSRIVHEPLGCALIVAPWNYPFQLLMMPLIGAISAGCCALLKTSPNAPHTAKLVEEMLAELYPEEYVAVVHGGREVNTHLFSQKFDTIFFTGSPKVGKVVMEAAAKHLTPVVLELGGKSPAIVNQEADIRVAARRIAWGKSINAGQTCIAPDYLLIHHSVKTSFIEEFEVALKAMYGNEPKESDFYPRIVSDKAMERLTALRAEGEVLIGGNVDWEQRYIEPTLIEGIEPSDPIMQQEIFGPLLPIMTFDEIDEAIEYINKGEKPLALYYFGSSKSAKRVVEQTTSGGCSINDTLMHVSNHNLPFGGVGNSGMGKYHGHDSFLAFSNRRAVVSTPTAFDMPFKYAPFRFLSAIKRIL